MHQTKIKRIGKELESRLSVFFIDQSYSICCGRHWRDRGHTPSQVADTSIKVKMTRAGVATFSSGVIQLHYTVRSEQPSHVFANFCLSRGAETGAHHSIVEFIMRAFGTGTTLVNSGVQFFGEPYVWFVVRDPVNKYFFHINLYPKFGFED